MSTHKNIFAYLKKKRLPASKAVLDDILPKPVNFCALFLFSTKRERFALFTASLFAIVAGMCLPFINLIYGELTNIMIERQFPTDKPSQKAIILEWFGGGRVLVNASQEERMKALDEDATAFAASVAVFSVLALVFLALSMFAFNLMAYVQVKRIRMKLFRTLLSQSAAWFDLRNQGNFIHNITEDLNNVQNGIGERLAIFIYQMSTTVIILGVSFYLGWLLTLVLLGCMVPMFVIFLVLNQIQSGISANGSISAESASDAAEEALTNIRTVVAYGGEKKEYTRYANKLLVTQSLDIKKGVVAAFGIGFVWTIIHISYAVGFSFGFRLIVWDDDYNPTVLISVFFGVLTAATILSYSGPYWESFANARGSAAVVFRIIGTKSDINPFSKDGISGGDTKGEIQFKNIHFHYPSRPEENLLKGLSFIINPGEKVAIVGSSGSGKSTVLQLIQRLYDPVSGDIFLDGVNLRSLNVSWLRQQIGVVLQEPVLFTGTISENIAYGLPNATDLEIKEAAKLAQAHEFILHLPEQYDTMLTGTTGTLSGGQKQRIAIARAIIRKPKILLLDEITSALDSENAKLVQQTINSAETGLTSITVTNDLTSLSRMDKIIVLEGGVAAEEGTHDALIKLHGVYSRLLKADTDNKDKSFSKRKLDGLRDTAKSPVEESVQVLPGAKGHFVSDFNVGSREKVGEKLHDNRLLMVNCCQFLSWNKSHWPFLYFGILSSIIIGCTFPVLIILFGELVGLLSRLDTDAIYSVDLVSLLLGFIGFISGIISFIQTWFLSVASARLGTHLRLKTFKTMLGQEMAWFDSNKNKASNLCGMLSVDCSALQAVISGRIGLILQGLTAMLLGVFISIYYSWKLTLVTILVIPLIFSGIFVDMYTSGKRRKLDEETEEVERKRFGASAMPGHELVGCVAWDEKLKSDTIRLETYARHRTEKVQDLMYVRSFREPKDLGVVIKSAARSSITTEALNNIKVVKSLGCESQLVVQFAETLKKRQTRSKFGGFLLRGFAYSLGQTTMFFGNAVSLWFGAYLIKTDDLHYKDVIKVSELIIYGCWVLGQALALAPNFRKAKEAAGRLQYLYHRKPRMLNGTLPFTGDNSVQYSSVYFSYPGRSETLVLKNINLSVRDGESVALIGESGSGKSSVIKLLMRFYDPSLGSISLGKVKLQNYKLSSLRHSIGLVSQEPVLFDRTIYDNIAYGDNDKEVSMEEVVAAAKAADIHNFISSLPAGYDTKVGRFSSRLSGGQKQKIAIARALIRNPRILLLDEATSALDPESERSIQETLDRAMYGRTTITVAHKWEATVNADTIYVITEGRITESGTHTELMKQKGFYYRLRSEHLS